MTSYEKLENRFRQLSHLEHIRSVVSWDEQVIMPAGAAAHRNAAMAELVGVIENLLRGPEVGDWLKESETLPLEGWRKANLREMRRQYVLQTAMPPELSKRLVIARMTCEQEWRRLRGLNDWKTFQPLLREVLELTRESIAAYRKHDGLSAYDTALALYSPGLSTEIVEKLFGELKSFLPGLVRDVVEKQKNDRVLVPEGPFPMAAQKALGLELMQAIGFAPEIGRLDEAFHPFSGGTFRDARITTRYDQNEFISSLMGVLHETGHALYEQNLPEEWITQPVGASCGMAIHESQSLFLEMQVCRSREFLEFAGPFIRKHMGPHVKNPASLTNENLAQLVTRVEPGFIRVDADEVTYPAHVILRFEIERDLLEDRWPLSELPAVWDEKMKSYLGLSTFGNDKDGCMQDVHWPGGAFGYFPAYTFGAVIAAQLFAKLSEALPGARGGIARGEFGPIQSWLRENIWSQGTHLKTLELVESAAGPLSTTPFRKHLEARYR